LLAFHSKYLNSLKKQFTTENKTSTMNTETDWVFTHGELTW